MIKSTVTHPLKPYYQSDSKILILGTMPSIKSREMGFYYMHPKNRFWEVLSMIYQEPLPNTIDAKKIFLKKHQIALWDVIQSCDMVKSSDASISNVTVNDIPSLLNKTKIEKIYTVGKKAYLLYQKYVYPKIGLDAIFLPSTSPANATFKIDDLLQEYQVIKGETYENHC